MIPTKAERRRIRDEKRRQEIETGKRLRPSHLPPVDPDYRPIPMGRQVLAGMAAALGLFGAMNEAEGGAKR